MFMCKLLCFICVCVVSVGSVVFFDMWRVIQDLQASNCVRSQKETNFNVRLGHMGAVTAKCFTKTNEIDSLKKEIAELRAIIDAKEAEVKA